MKAAKKQIGAPTAIESWEVGRLTPYARNPRLHTDREVEELAHLILSHGWTNPILVDETDGIIAGHRRLRAALYLGMTHVPVIVLTGMSDAGKRAYIIADNQSSLHGAWDTRLLHEELDAVIAGGLDPGTAAAFTDAELEALDKAVLPPGGDDDDDGDGGDGGGGGGRGLGNPVISYTIIFETEDQQRTWYDFARWLRAKRGQNDGEFTMGRLFSEFGKAAMEDGDR